LIDYQTLGGHCQLKSDSGQERDVQNFFDSDDVDFVHEKFKKFTEKIDDLMKFSEKKQEILNYVGLGTLR